MNEEQKAWSKQYNGNFGVKEFLRLGCAIIIWIFIGAGVSLAFELAGFHISSIILAIFLIAMFVFPFFIIQRKSTYSLLRKILGNENLPREPFPRSATKISREPRPWWSYLPSIWWILIDILLLLAVLGWLFK